MEEGFDLDNPANQDLKSAAGARVKRENSKKNQ